VASCAEDLVWLLSFAALRVSAVVCAPSFAAICLRNLPFTSYRRPRCALVLRTSRASVPQAAPSVRAASVPLLVSEFLKRSARWCLATGLPTITLYVMARAARQKRTLVLAARILPQRAMMAAGRSRAACFGAGFRLSLARQPRSLFVLKLPKATRWPLGRELERKGSASCISLASASK
jgi:hypothetical protein